MGWGWDWDVDVYLHLRHEVDATSRMGWGGIGMLTPTCTCIMKLMLRHAWVLRRVNKLGRLAPSKSHVDPLAMQRLLDEPGFEALLEAMQFYRSKRMGQLDWSPAAFGVLRGDNSWLNV